MKKQSLCGAVFGLALFSGTTLASTGNLLSNPGAETGDLTGWSITGPAIPFVDTGVFDPGTVPHSGSFDFVGGEGNISGKSGPTGALSQVVDLLANGVSAADLDSGNSSANVSFWEQGLDQGTPSDDAYIQVSFLDGSSNPIGSPSSTPEIDSHNFTWQQYSTSFPIPTGTRFIDYSMQFVRHAGVDLDGFVDDNSLSIQTPRGNVPETLGSVWTWGALLALLPIHRRLRNRSQRQAA